MQEGGSWLLEMEFDTGNGREPDLYLVTIPLKATDQVSAIQEGREHLNRAQKERTVYRPHVVYSINLK